MPQDDDVLKLFDRLDLINKLFEQVRLVDPIKSKVMIYHNNSVTYSDSNCFDAFGKDQTCSNCIGRKALDENQTFVKLEYSLTGVCLVMAVPVQLDGKNLVLELLKDITHSLIAQDEHMETNADVQLLLKNMKNLAMKDALTDIFNRRYMDEKLQIDVSHAVLAQQNLSLIIADIDFFKNTNDTYGHLAGDAVLKSFAQTLCNSLHRDTDWVARYGGEEFIICLPGAKLKKASEVAESMRTAVEETAIAYGANSIKITASFGVCSLESLEDKSMNSMIESADQKLYLAKRSGRNRVES